MDKCYPDHAGFQGNGLVDCLASRVPVAGIIIMDKGDIVKHTYKHMLVNDTRTDKMTLARMIEFEIKWVIMGGSVCRNGSDTFTTSRYRE